MTDKANLKEETKKHIRGLILSSPVGLTVRELRKDYEDFIGQPIPFRQLGFTSLEDFLDDINDTVCTSYQKGVMVLKAPSDPTTQHIERLVSRQKITNKKKWAVLRKPPPRKNVYRPPPVVPSQLRHQIQDLFKSFSDGLPLTHFEACFSKRFGFQLDYKRLKFSTLSELLESIPSVVKLVPFQNGEWRVLPLKYPSTQRPLPSKNISKNTTASKTGGRVENSQPRKVSSQSFIQKPTPTKPVAPLSRDLQAQIPPQQNFQTPTSNIPSLLDIQVQNPYQGQNVGAGTSFQNQPVRLIKAGNMLYQVPVMPNIYVPTSSLQYLPPNMAANMSMSYSQRFQNTSQDTAVQQHDSNNAFQPTKQDTPMSQDKKDNLSTFTERQRHQSGQNALSDLSGQSFDSADLMFEDDSGIPQELQEEIREVLSMRSNGIWASQLLFEYKKTFKKELPFKEHGFHSVVEFVSTLPKDVVTIQRPSKRGDWLLLDARLQKDSTAGGDNNEQMHSSVQNPKENTMFRESVRQVLQHHPEGILMQEFPAKYKEMTGRTLKDEISYCGSLEKLCISLTDDVLQINYKGDGCLMLHAIHSDVSQKFDKLLEPYQPHATQDTLISDEDQLPADVVGPGTYFSQIPLPDHRDYIEIYVSNIVSPGVFWIQFRHKNHTMALERLMDDLEFYRTSAADVYKMHPSLIAVGQVVAVIFPEDDNWHRGIITSIRTMDFVDVYYVDYGNTCSVHKKNLRLLRTRYLKLPAQAVQARLSNIQPAGGKWTEQSKAEMLKVCVNKPVIALVTDIKNRVLSICVTDTSAEVDLHLNDHLVSEGFAEFAPDELQTASVYPGSMREIPDDCLLYGFKFTSEDGMLPLPSSMATANQLEAGGGDNSGYPSSSEGCSQRFVQLVELIPDVCIHLINWEQEPWLISAEISALFWEEDVLRSKLQNKRLLVKKQVLSKGEQSGLFRELLYYGVKSVNESKTFVTIYSLKGLPAILEHFHHPNQELKARVEEIISEFDPEDLYWQGEDGDMAADIQRELEETQLGLDELKVTLQALQFKRKRILQSLLSESGCETDYVNQLAEVELQISKTKELMEEVEATLGCEVTDIESELKTQSAAASPEKNIKTNRVAPLIVRHRVDSLSSGDTHVANSTSSTNQNLAVQSSEQMVHMMTQGNATTFDSSLYGMMFPAIQNSVMQQMSSLGRGQPIMQQKGEGQGVPMMPWMSMFNPGHVNQSSNSNLTTCPNVTPAPNVSSGIVTTNSGSLPLQSLMTMPHLQAMMAANSQMTNLQTSQMATLATTSQINNPRLKTPMPCLPNMGNMAGIPSMAGMANMQNFSSLGHVQGMMGVAGSVQDVNNPPNIALLPELIPLLNNLNVGSHITKEN